MIHKTTRSILSVLLAALLLVTSPPLTPAFADGGGVSPQPESGEGRVLEQVDGVYQIGSAAELRDFAKLVNSGDLANADAVLTANIDLSEICGENIGGQSVSWTPIGNSINEYSGTFDGANYTISGLTINDSTADYQGLFGYVSGTVKDLTVTGSVSGNISGNWVGGVVGYNGGTVENCHNIGEVSSNRYVGGVVGYNGGTVENCHNIGEVSGNRYVGGVVGENGTGATVSNCYNTGTITGTDDYVGGVVGYNGGSGTVKNCHNIGEVSGNRYVGGVVGSNRGRVENCYNTGEVSGNRYVGGVVGYNGGGGNVTNSYNTGAVSGGEDVGGVVGYNISSVTNCYNTGSVSGPDNGTGNRVGGVVGYNDGGRVGGRVENCYNTGSVSGGISVGGVVGDNYSGGSVTGCYFLQQGELQGIGDEADATGATGLTADQFKDQNSFTKWDFGSTGIPGIWETNTTLGRPVLKDNHEDDGSKDHPYEIFTATQLKNFRDLVNDENGNPAAWAVLMENITLNSSEEWTPIGSDSRPYTGTFDGNGKTISGLYINNTSSDTAYQGLFGYLGTSGDNKGTVQNLTVTGSVKSDYYVGGVVGYNNGGTVTGCIFSGSGSVSGSYYVGGVVGENSGSVINCYNTGSVTGVTGVTGSSDYVGGVVGSNNNASVENCYNIGKVTGSADSSNVGGVVGQNNGSSTVENSYNTGAVSGGEYVGGVVGYNHSGGSVTNSYNTGTGTVTGTGDYVGGVVGWNSGNVTNCYNTDSVSGLDSVGGVVGDNRGTVENCYNTGTVTGSYYVDGVVGDNSGTVKNCYYQIDKGATVGIGNETTADTSKAEGKTDAQFASGEVAYLLQSKQTTPVWGQNLMKEPKDNYPQLRAFDADTPQVYKVAFMNDSEEHDAKYANSGMTVGSPTTNPTKEGHTFAGWFTESSGGSQWNFSTAVTKNMTLYAQWTAVEEPDPTPTPDPEPAGPSTGDSSGWDDILDELENTAKGDEITIDMGDETKVPAEIFESLAGKDVDVTFDLGDVQWSVNGADIPTDADFTDLDLGVNLDTHGIPVNVINTITGEVGTVQITLAHDGEFGFTMTLTAPLGEENAGYWANLYHYDEDAEALNFEAAAKIDEDGSVTIPFSHASQYAIVIDTHSHARVAVSDIFTDVAPNAWYTAAIQYAYDNGLMTGVSATEFAPEQTTTRAMIVSILARLEGVTTAQAAGFADVNDNDWYATAVNWAANVGVVNGYEDNTFKPNTAITREQLAAILMNYAAYKGYDVSARADLSHYSDADSISSWANDVLLWAVAEGLLTGVTDDTIAPQAHATRAQVAAILQRFLSE